MSKIIPTQIPESLEECKQTHCVHCHLNSDNPDYFKCAETLKDILQYYER